MRAPPLTHTETCRLRALQSLRMLDTEPEERFDRVTRVIRKVFGVPIALLSIVDSDRVWFKSRQGSPVSEVSREHSFCAHTILDEATMVVPDTREDPRFSSNPAVVDAPHLRFYAGHPVHSPDGQRVGSLCIMDGKPRQMDDDEVATLVDFASLVEQEFALLAETTTDELTRLSNRRGFLKIAEHVVGLCRRNGQPASVVVIDLNGFKGVNDSLGHEAGDELLRAFAGLLITQFRDSDVVARLGGDEFCVLTSGSGAAQTQMALDRLSAALTDSQLARQHPGLAFSAGIAELDGETDIEIESLLREADEKMYANKTGAKLRQAEGQRRQYR